MNTEMNLENLTKKELIIRCKELNIKGYSNKKKDEVIEMIKETEQILRDLEIYEKEQLERKKFLDNYNDSLKELKVYNIVCLKCNLTLEPHTQEQHLDINHEIHRCDTYHKIGLIKKEELEELELQNWMKLRKKCIWCLSKVKDTTTYRTREKTWANCWCSESCHRIWSQFGMQKPY